MCVGKTHTCILKGKGGRGRKEGRNERGKEGETKGMEGEWKAGEGCSQRLVPTCAVLVFLLQD